MKSKVMAQVLKDYQKEIKEEKTIMKLVFQNLTERAPLTQKGLDSLRKRCRAAHRLYAKISGVPIETIETKSDNAWKIVSNQLPDQYMIEAAEKYLPMLADEIEAKSKRILALGERISAAIRNGKIAERKNYKEPCRNTTYPLQEEAIGRGESR